MLKQVKLHFYLLSGFYLSCLIVVQVLPTNVLGKLYVLTYSLASVAYGAYGAILAILYFNERDKNDEV